MQAAFYENKSDRRYLNKTITVKYSDIPIEVLNPTSVIRPTLKVSSGLIGQSVNYLYIEELERYYYINNWIMENGHILLECEVDVLMSFKSSIQNQNVIISRQRDYYDRYLEDDKIKVRNYDCIRTVQFPHGFESLNIILGVVGKTTNSN